MSESEEDETSSFLSNENSLVDEYCATPTVNESRQIGVLQMTCLTFFAVCSGPVGSEEAIAAVGPIGMTIFFVFPIFYCIPVMLLYAESSCAYPQNSKYTLNTTMPLCNTCLGGFVIWVRNSFGASVSFQVGYWRWISSVLNSSLFAILLLDLSLGKGSVSVVRFLLCTFISVSVGVLNFSGLGSVGRSVTLLCVCAITPYIAMSLMWFVRLIFPQISLEASSDIVIKSDRPFDWLRLLHVAFWDFNGWDSGASYAGKIIDPSKTLPRSLSMALLLVTLVYSVPLAIGLLFRHSPPWQQWKEGTMLDIASAIGGKPLKVLVMSATWTHLLGMFVSEVFSNGCVVQGMAENGLLPKYLAGTDAAPPKMAISTHIAMIVCFTQFVEFETLMHINNSLSALPLLIEILAALRDRTRRKDDVIEGRIWKARFLSNHLFLLILVIPVMTLLTIIVSSLMQSNIQVQLIVSGLMFSGLPMEKLVAYVSLLRNNNVKM